MANVFSGIQLLPSEVLIRCRVTRGLVEDSKWGMANMHDDFVDEMKCRVTGELVDLSECCGKCSECEYGAVRFIPRRVIKERRADDERRKDSGG